jgi:hypothetical protein
MFVTVILTSEYYEGVYYGIDLHFINEHGHILDISACICYSCSDLVWLSFLYAAERKSVFCTQKYVKGKAKRFRVRFPALSLF